MDLLVLFAVSLPVLILSLPYTHTHTPREIDLFYSLEHRVSEFRVAEEKKRARGKETKQQNSKTENVFNICQKRQLVCCIFVAIVLLHGEREMERPGCISLTMTK